MVCVDLERKLAGCVVVVLPQCGRIYAGPVTLVCSSPIRLANFLLGYLDRVCIEVLICFRTRSIGVNPPVAAGRSEEIE